MPAKINIGIRREDINKGERRAPLIPTRDRGKLTPHYDGLNSFIV
jgi:hypothetical protein